MKTLEFVQFKIALLFILIVLPSSHGQETSRKSLTGNWGGFRDTLVTKGISIKPRITFFQQNFVAGTGNKESIFAGKADLKMLINGTKIGLPKLTLVTQIEQNFGKSLNGSGGVVIPLNTATTFPGIKGEDAFDFTSLYFMYQFGKKNSLLLGKINVIDLASSSLYSGGAGISSFWNMNFAAPVSGITPAYIVGGIGTIYCKTLKYTLMVYDPVGAVNRSGFEKPFPEGVTFSASVEKEVQLWGMLGSHSLKAAYSTRDGANLYDLDDLILPIPEHEIERLDDRYYFSYKFTQQLGDIAGTDKGWGLFGQLGISDGNPNPVDFGALFGVGGHSFFKSRADDTWGIGVYHYSLSKPIDEFAAEGGLPLRNETGTELYYEAKLYKWFSIGGDVQYIIPMVKDNKPALFLGLRSSIIL